VQLNDFFASHLSTSPVIGIFRGLGTTRTVELCRVAWDSGVRLIEIPLQSQDDLAALREAIAAGRAIGRPVGAGTITSPRLMNAAAEAGAAFTVAPGLNAAVAREAQHLNMPHLPGVATSTEIGSALDLGFAWQKMFPAAQLGPSWISAQLAPYPDVRLVATGGVTAFNAKDYMTAGAAAVAVGTAFADPHQIARLSALARPV
jgi:2-dehydro-3-deoxyphosphogluconate aldolase/(4S)-4-hydroxy-2-oxoglutarate aldolase